MDFADEAASVGQALLLDTCVYVDLLEGTLPGSVEALILARPVMHLAAVLGELSHNFGRLDPKHARTREHQAELAGIFADIRAHRLDTTIEGGVWLEAGILSGLVFRLGGFQRGQEVSALIDAVVYLHALERGFVVLTRNLRDFDFMNQIVPAGRVLFYRI